VLRNAALGTRLVCVRSRARPSGCGVQAENAQHRRTGLSGDYLSGVSIEACFRTAEQTVADLTADGELQSQLKLARFHVA